MPELPEVETVRKTLLRHLKGRTITRVDIIYPNIFENQNLNEIKKNIVGQKINDMQRRGKWLIFVLDDFYLLSHLRMEGKYLYRNVGEVLGAHEHVVFTIDNKEELRYKDVRKFGKMYLVKKDELLSCKALKDLGLEPWDENLTFSYLKDKYRMKRLPIKSVLLDQSIIVGIGNIYADEILFLSKINPYAKASSLNDNDLCNIIKYTKEVLNDAIKKGGTTIRSYTSEEGVTGLFQNDLYVHQREKEKCRICNSIIEKTRIGGRGTYFCPKCQNASK